MDATSPSPDPRSPRPAGSPGPSGTRSPRRRLLAAVAVAMTVAAGVYAYWVPNAPSDPQPVGDAVVVHAGADRERVALGLALMDQGAAPTLVIMLGRDSRRTRSLCGAQEPYEVLCPGDLDPATTLGESRALADLVEARGWQRVVTVTSDYHLRRAVHLDSRCGSVEVVGSATSGRAGDGVRAFSILKELLALPRAWLQRC